MKVKDLFTLKQGNSLELMHLEANKSSNVNFISRTSQGNGVVAQVEALDAIKPFAPALISVALSGNGVCSAFVQPRPFYTAFHIMVLTPKIEMTLQVKLFYCMCIKKNAYKYCWGRQANKTLKDLELPDTVPEWVHDTPIEPIKTLIDGNNIPALNSKNWREFEMQNLFTIKYGVNLELSNCEIIDKNDIDGVNFVARTATNNGVVARVKKIRNIKAQQSGLLSCAGGGSVLSTFVQSQEFYSGRDLYLLIPKMEMSIYCKLFISTLVRANRYKFNYGRQANKSLPQLLIKLPVISDGSPDWAYMEQYIKSLSYSDRI